jgi:hypothetical protein
MAKEENTTENKPNIKKRIWTLQKKQYLII